MARAALPGHRISVSELLGKSNVAKTPINIFLSAGGPATELQRLFISQLKDVLKTENLESKTPPLGDKIEDTIKMIEATMNDCSGAIILAFERVYIERGQEFRGGSLPNRMPRPLTDARLTTVWNQIEAAMAELRGLPLLIMFEKGLRIDGFLEHNTWRPIPITLDVGQLGTDDFRKRLTNWKSRVEAFNRKRITRRSWSVGMATALGVTLFGVAFGAMAGGWIGYREGSRLLVK
jgi:hypothetical protein